MDKQAALVRDEFNLNKILIVVTSVGKVKLKKKRMCLVFVHSKNSNRFSEC